MRSRLVTLARRAVHYIPRVNDDFIVAGVPGKPLTIVVRDAHDSIEILSKAEKMCVNRLNIIAETIHGDLGLRHAPAVVNKVRIWVQNLEGDIELPKTGFMATDGHRQTENWLRLHIGPIKDIAGQIRIQTQFDDVFNRLKFLERKAEQIDPAKKTVHGHTDDYTIKVEKHPQNPDAVGEGSMSYYITMAEDDIHIMPRYEGSNEPVPEINLFIGTAHKGVNIN